MSPPRIDITQIQTELIPVTFVFGSSVDGISFTLTHELWGDVSLTGSSTSVAVEITEGRADDAVGTYSYRLVAHPGVAGSEHIVAYGTWAITATPDSGL